MRKCGNIVGNSYIDGNWKRNQRLKCKMQNCGGPSGGFVLKKKKTGGIVWRERS